MTTELPRSGPEREMMLRALRAYSDNCEPPYLTPGCPFAVDLNDGTRGCGEECIELIAQLGVPPGVEEVSFGDGTGLRVSRRRRPRARSGPDESSRPFDAAEIYLQDSSTLDLELWSPVSLIYELRQALGEPPPEDEVEAKDRRERIHRLVAILDERGIDFDRFLREPLARAQGVILGVVSVLGSSIELDEADADSRIAEIGKRWRTLLDLDSRPAANSDPRLDVAMLIIEHVPRTATWAMSASLDELIDWWPSKGEVPEADAHVLSRLTDGDDWITDRFLATYLEHWSTSSLHAEWEWIHGRRESPIPLPAMRARRVDHGRLASQIADIAASERARRSSPVAMGQYQALAGRLLAQGRREAAVGVFEGVLAVEPEDPEAHNNRGFCLLPDDPGGALDSLERARDLGYEPSVINTANHVLALMSLHRLAAANDLAERGFLEASLAAPVPARLWDPATITSDPTLIEIDDTARYLADLGVQIAQRVRNEPLEAVWSARRAERAAELER